MIKDYVPIIVALIVSIPGYLAWMTARKTREMVNGQTQLLLTVVGKAAKAEGAREQKAKDVRAGRRK